MSMMGYVFLALTIFFCMMIMRERGFRKGFKKGLKIGCSRGDQELYYRGFRDGLAKGLAGGESVVCVASVTGTAEPEEYNEKKKKKG